MGLICINLVFVVMLLNIPTLYKQFILILRMLWPCSIKMIWIYIRTCGYDQGEVFLVHANIKGQGCVSFSKCCYLSHMDVCTF